MKPREISPDNTVFLIISFEGPDQYSKAGGLGVRVAELADSLADMEFETHLLFVGDPSLPGEEVLRNGKLHFHRWGQWISNYFPDGVYQGENQKLYDFNDSVPPWVLHNVVKPAAEQGKIVAILGEEWHTAEVMCRISDLLHYNRLRDTAILFWNANNVFSFDRINWSRLGYTNTITTVSRYMKHRMWEVGTDPLVIPNGIPRRALEPVDESAVERVRKALGADPLLFKIGRFDPDKRWNMAVEAVARLKGLGMHPVMPIRGGIEPHGAEVLANARRLGLTVKEVRASGRAVEDCVRAIESAADSAEILDLRFFLPDEFVRVMYRAADAVLANSGHEPFGLVGLEVMGAGGVAFTGSTGEDYAIPFDNAVVLDTSDPGEIVGYVAHLRFHTHEADLIRERARHTAETFLWDRVIENLTAKLEYVARNQGVLAGVEEEVAAAPARRGGARPRSQRPRKTAGGDEPITPVDELAV
ncbi:MAG TPA: glycosyltransferase [Chloroflexota bacterium]